MQEFPCGGLVRDVADVAAIVAMFVGQTLLIFVQRAGWLASGALESLAECIEFPPLAGLTHFAARPIPFAPFALGGIASTIWWESFKP